MSSHWSAPSFPIFCGPSTCTISWKKSAICWSKSRRSKLLCATCATNLASCAKRRKRPPSPIPCLPPAIPSPTRKRRSPIMSAKKAKRSRNARAAASIWATRTAAVKFREPQVSAATLVRLLLLVVHLRAQFSSFARKSSYVVLTPEQFLFFTARRFHATTGPGIHPYCPHSDRYSWWVGLCLRCPAYDEIVASGGRLAHSRSCRLRKYCHFSCRQRLLARHERISHARRGPGQRRSHCQRARGRWDSARPRRTAGTSAAVQRQRIGQPACAPQ